MDVKAIHAGQTGAFALKKVKRSSIRKGMVMLHPKLNPKGKHYIYIKYQGGQKTWKPGI